MVILKKGDGLMGAIIKNKYLELLFINMIILNLNFGSWAYVLFWLLLAFFIVLFEKNMEVK